MARKIIATTVDRPSVNALELKNSRVAKNIAIHDVKAKPRKVPAFVRLRLCSKSYRFLSNSSLFILRILLRVQHPEEQGLQRLAFD